MIYDGWACELQDDLRFLRDRRILTDLDLGIYGDAHSELILACTNEDFLVKVKQLIDSLSDEERIKAPITLEVAPSDEPPMYDEATEDMTEEEKEVLNKQAEKNLLDLQEKLRLLEEQLEREERSKLAKIAESPEENQAENNTEIQQDENKSDENLIDVTEATESIENLENNTKEENIVAEEEQSETVVKLEEKAEVVAEIETAVEVEENSQIVDETEIAAETTTEEAKEESSDVQVVCELGPEDVKIEVEVKQESSVKDEEESNQDPELTDELAKSIESKEKEALQIANETIKYMESKESDDLPPTYEETTSSPIAQIAITDLAPKPEAHMPTVAAICAFFYTGEIIVSKKNYEELREYGIQLGIEAFGRATEEFVNMMGPDTDEENDVGSMRYKFRDVPLVSNMVLTSFEAIYRHRRSLKPEDLDKLEHSQMCVYRGEEIHRLLLSATCETLREKVEMEISADTDQAVLKRIIEFVYSGKIPCLTQTMGREVLIVAKRLGFSRLVNIMVDWLMNRIKADNCIELQLLGVDHDIKSLAERARHFVLRNFKDVSKTESFKELPSSWLCDYVEDDLVEVDFPADKGELLLFQQCKKWAETHPTERVNEFADIITRAIRFELMSVKDLVDTVSNDGMVLDNKMATNHIADIIEYKNQNQVPNGRLRGSEAVIIAGGSVPIIDDTKGGVYEGEDHHVYDSSILGSMRSNLFLFFFSSNRLLLTVTLRTIVEQLSIRKRFPLI